MLEKMNQIAEDAATNVSRRGFLDLLGRGALATAGAIGALLAAPINLQAGRGGRCPTGYHWCRKSYECIPKDQQCPKGGWGY